jgi:hypothetical protein
MALLLGNEVAMVVICKEIAVVWRGPAKNT